MTKNIPLFGNTKKRPSFGLCFLLLLVLLGLGSVPKDVPGNEGSKKDCSIERSFFGKTNEGNDVYLYTMANAQKTVLKVLDFGGVIYSLELPDKKGNLDNVSANLATVPEYQKYRPYFGSLIGRYGNRIARGQFTLDGKKYSIPTNDGANSLHGGLKGFDQKIWTVTPFEGDRQRGLKMTYLSKDGEEGYPGNLKVTVRYILTDTNDLIIDYTATTDKPTPINLTNHTFWNLGGVASETIRDHILTLGADRYLPTDSGLIPTGEIASVEGTPLDFRTPKLIGRDIGKITSPQFNGGFDHCMILAKDNVCRDGFCFCAKVRDPKSGRTMEIRTTEPAVQFYSGNFLDGSTGNGNNRYQKHSFFCLETQHYPDSPNQSAFPSTILTPDKTYRQTTIHHFGIE